MNLKSDLYEQEGVLFYAIVDPKEDLAKVYKLNSEGRYIKIAEAYNDSVDFSVDGCGFTFNFSKIW